MKTEEKKNNSELITKNKKNTKFETNINKMKKILKNKLNHTEVKNKTKNIFSDNSRNKKFKMFGTQTIQPEEQISNIKIKAKKTINVGNRNKNRKILFNEIKSLCDNMYNINNFKNNNLRIKLGEDIIKSIDHYVTSDLRKDILRPKKTFMFKNDKSIKIQKLKLLRREIQEKKEINFDSNKVSMKDTLKKCDDNSQLKNRRIKVYRYKFEDYAINNVKYNHPQIYTLNNLYGIRNIYPNIKPQTTLNSIQDFTKLIPEKSSNKRELNKQIYKVYKTMKTKNKHELGIHI